MAARAREAQGRDHRRAGGAARCSSAGRRGRARRSGSSGPTSATWRPRIWPSAIRSISMAPPWRSCASARSAAARRGQAAGLQSRSSSSTAGSRPIRWSRSSTTTCRSWSTASAIELNRHGLGIHLIIHPVLAVRRDAAGRLLDLGTAARGRRRPARELHACSRSTGRATRACWPQLEADLRRVLGDVAPRRRRTGAPCASRIDEVLAELACRRRRRCRPSSATEARGVPDAGWPTIISPCSATVHYALEENADGVAAAARQGHRAGHPARQGRWRAVAELQLPCRPRSAGARAEPLPLLTITKANTRSTVHRGTYLDFIGVKRFAPDGTVIGEHRFLGLLTSAAYSMSPHADSAARPQGRADRRARRLPADRPCRQGASPHPRDLSARRAAPDLRGRAVRDRDRHPAPAGSASGCGCSCGATRSPASCRCLVYVPRDRYNTALRERMQQLLRAGGGRHRERVPGAAVGIVAGAAAVHPAHARMACRPISTPPSSSGGCSSSRAAGPIACAKRCSKPAARSRATGCSTAYGRAFPASYQERVDARAAVPDIVSIDRLSRGGCRRSGDDASTAGWRIRPSCCASS